MAQVAFATNLSRPQQARPSAQVGNRQPAKRRAACDECRGKKLKCTGEQPACSRCARENITCVYSAQKQMGRPKKKQRTEDESFNASGDAAPAWDIGIGAYPSDFAPDGNLQPWLQVDNWSYPTSATEHAQRTASTTIPNETAVPGLTPDSDSSLPSQSPPILNLPPELRNTTQDHHAITHTHLHTDASTNMLLDPSLTNNTSDLSMSCGVGAMPSCACLSTMYLTLNSLQSMDPAFTFPFALHPLREAIQTATEVVACQECPTRFITAIQNTQLLGTLLISIAERYSKVLDSITSETQRAAAANENKIFRLADLNTSTSHLHTGNLGCAAAFTINLSPSEWRQMTKKVVRAEVYGPTAGNDCCAYFMDLVDQMERRQEYWHDKPVPEDFPVDARTGEYLGGRNMPREEHMCLKYVAYARKMVVGFDWT